MEKIFELIKLKQALQESMFRASKLLSDCGRALSRANELLYLEKLEEYEAEKTRYEQLLKELNNFE